tara:strand:+ start:236 stop:343 length:108 start_codon:yes stop_codon:yes gene_type:complete
VAIPEAEAVALVLKDNMVVKLALMGEMVVVVELVQ